MRPSRLKSEVASTETGRQSTMLTAPVAKSTASTSWARTSAGPGPRRSPRPGCSRRPTPMSS
eukprot:9428856-Alexandrium_andersonii.AAC.1